jgi:hypothetical protein
MPKSIIFTDLLPPTALTSSVISGGTLATGSTYYYVIQACFDAGSSALTTNGRSQSSNEVSSAITTSGSQAISLSWTASSGAGGYRVYRATSSAGYADMLNVAVRTSVNCVGGICTITDTGLGTPGNTQYQNIVHGKLDLLGSTSSDPFSIVDLYNSSSANGWGVVERLDEDTYTVNTLVNGHTNIYWNDKDKVIIFRDYLNAGSGGNYTFGEKNLVNGVTQRGCRIIFKTPDLYSTSFSALFAYKTTFDYVRFNPLIAYANISPQNITFSSGSVEYCLINKLRSFSPNSKTLCSMSDTTITQADVALGTGLASFSNITGMGNSRVFQTTNNTQITGSNVKFISNFASTLLIGNNFSVKYINSISASLLDVIQPTTPRPIGITQDVFTYDLRVSSTNNTPISGASVQLINVSGSTLINTNTDSLGRIPQQEVLLYQRIISGGLGPTQNLSPYTLIVNKSGFNEYREVTTYSSSIALEKTIALTQTGSLDTNIFGGTFYNSIIY